MSDLDDRLRTALSGLREAQVPAAPRGLPSRPEPRPTPTALFAAAAMLIVLAATLYFMPRQPVASPAAVADRITTLETRVSRFEHEELRALLDRELALLRRELELSQKAP